MFRKQFNVRKNTNLRGSDTRKLVTRLSDEVGPDAAGFDKKSQVAQVKIVNMHGDGMNLYLVDKTPMFFDFSESGVVYPSVFFLWKHPISYPTLLVHEPVLQYLENGADLMLPGVVRTEQFPIPEIRKGGPVAIALYSQGQITGPVAVGCSLLSSQEMIASRFQGKGVQVLHVFRDALWEFGPRGQPPVAKLDELLRCAQEQAVPTNEDFPALGELSVNEQTPEPTPSHSQSGSEIAKGSEAEVGDCEEDDTSETETSESLLMRCFLAGLKFRLKKLPQPLPVDVGQFYVQCVLACVPGDRRLDMKKTKYKKFAAFLDEMVESSAEKGTEPIICLNKKVKGSERLSDVNWDHPLLKAFKATDEKLVDEDPNENDANKIVPPTISEYFLVTDPVLPLLKTQVNSVEKGELLTTQKLRGLIIDYVNANGLKLKKDVRVDPQIAQIAKIKKDIVDWNTLFQSVQARMTPTWKIQWADGRTIVRKVTMPKIEFRVESRAGNKKVTLVNNLSLFGVDIKMFCQQVHTKVATSVTVNATAILCEGPQVFIQGNQVYFVGDLLMNTYGIDKKFIGGLELAPKQFGIGEKTFAVKKDVNLHGFSKSVLFERLSEEVRYLFNKNPQVHLVKIVSMHGDKMNLYLVDKTPMFFDYTQTSVVVFPSVFFLWTHPGFYPTLLVRENAYQKLKRGCDVTRGDVFHSKKYRIPQVRVGRPVAISVYANGMVVGPMAVGRCLISGKDLIDSAVRGRCVRVLHAFGDPLWQAGPRGKPPVVELDQFLRFDVEQS